MPNTTRRNFLATSSLAVAGVGLGLSARPLIAIPARSKRSVASFGPDIVDADTLRTLALRGIEAAKSAGASYADIRVSDRRDFQMAIFMPPVPESSMAFEYSFGIRVLVNGAWAFVYGAEPSPDGIVRAAQQAVTNAKGVAKVAGPAPQMVAAPVVKGEWTTPVKIDPFSVSPDEHAYMLGAFMNAAGRVPDGGMGPAFDWSYETRVFASSEGSLITQHLSQARPNIKVGMQPPIGMSSELPVSAVSPISAGFEIVIGPEYQEQIKLVAEDAKRLLGYPEAPVDVGRYEMAVDGTSFGAIMGATLVQALEMERVLGQEADGVGTSILAPVDDMVGQQLFSPQLSLAADRSMPHYGAAKWDDEGVETEAFPLIQGGKVVDYFATRSSTSALSDWYKKSGKPLRSHGAAIAWGPTRAPVGSGAHMTIASNASGGSLDDITKKVQNGFLVRGAEYVMSDQQLTGGSIYPSMVFEVKKGQITRRIKGAAFQFRTTNLWKALTDVGNESSVQMHVRNSVRGQPWAATTQVLNAPAGHFREIDVIDIGRRFR